MQDSEVEPNLKIITNQTLGSTTGMLIKQDSLNNRKPNEPGTVLGYVGGHGGDVWWIQHAHGIAPYCFDEFEPITE